MKHLFKMQVQDCSSPCCHPFTDSGPAQHRTACSGALWLLLWTSRKLQQDWAPPPQCHQCSSSSAKVSTAQEELEQGTVVPAHLLHRPLNPLNASSREESDLPFCLGGSSARCHWCWCSSFSSQSMATPGPFVLVKHLLKQEVRAQSWAFIFLQEAYLYPPLA